MKKKRKQTTNPNKDVLKKVKQETQEINEKKTKISIKKKCVKQRNRDREKGETVSDERSAKMEANKTERLN